MLILISDIRNNQKLQTIDLAGNKLTTLPASIFANTNNLETLYLSDNLLQVVDSNWWHPNTAPKLDHLDLSGNQLVTLPESGLVSVLPALSNLWLHGNQWRCDCSFMKPLDKLATKELLAPEVPETAVCAEPSSVKGTTLAAWRKNASC